MYCMCFICIHTHTTCSLYHAQVSHLRRNWCGWKYRRTESKRLCSVQLKRRIKILERKWTRECKLFRAFLFQLIKNIHISDVVCWYLQIVLAPFSVSWGKNCVLKVFWNWALCMQGTCNAAQMEQEQCRKTVSLRLISPEFSVNDENTKSKI